MGNGEIADIKACLHSQPSSLANRIGDNQNTESTFESNMPRVVRQTETTRSNWEGVLFTKPFPRFVQSLYLS